MDDKLREKCRLTEGEVKNSGYYCPYCDSEDCSGCGVAAYEAGYLAGIAKSEPIIRADIIRWLEKHNKFPQCKGLVLTVEDWQSLKEGEA